MRVALVTELPAPFRIPLFNELADVGDVELDVLFLAAEDDRRPYALHEDEFRFGHRFVRGRTVRVAGRWLALNVGLGQALDAVAPDAVVIGGWGHLGHWQALAWCRRRHVPAIAWVESTAHESKAGAAAKRLFLRGCAAVVVPGRASARLVGALGVEPMRVHVAPNAVDLGVFGEEVARLRATRPDGSPTLLSVGRLDREKGVDTLVRALALLPDDTRLIVVGTGTEAAVLHRLAEETAQGRVEFTGFLDRDELPAQYARADVYVLPSNVEPWGMTLNEAALAGLPIVATDVAGAAHELVAPGENGARVPAGDPAALARALRPLLADPEARRRAGERSLELVAGHTPQAWAAAVAGLLRTLAA